MNHEVRILNKANLNHNVIRFELEKPDQYTFKAGQAIELTLDDGKTKGPAPFTFTSLNSTPYLELMIKIYSEHKGLTAALSKEQPGSKVTITDPWDSFINKGPGVFIAGGAGITPFIAILRQLKVNNNIGTSSLFFFNKTTDDIFLETELHSLLGNRYVNVITRRDGNAKHKGPDEAFFRKHISNLAQPFYVCGPPGFMEALQDTLAKLGTKDEMVNVSF